LSSPRGLRGGGGRARGTKGKGGKDIRHLHVSPEMNELFGGGGAEGRGEGAGELEGGGVVAPSASKGGGVVAAGGKGGGGGGPEALPSKIERLRHRCEQVKHVLRVCMYTSKKIKRRKKTVRVCVNARFCALFCGPLFFFFFVRVVRRSWGWICLCRYTSVCGLIRTPLALSRSLSLARSLSLSPSPLTLSLFRALAPSLPVSLSPSLPLSLPPSLALKPCWNARYLRP
jgi:hypothetical protein